jgi:hypothetical protein
MILFADVAPDYVNPSLGILTSDDSSTMEVISERERKG